MIAFVAHWFAMCDDSYLVHCFSYFMSELWQFLNSYVILFKKGVLDGMSLFVEQIIGCCVKEQLISEDKIPWFRYSLEKRLYTFIGIIPFAILAVLISNIWCAICFLTVFFSLRSRINGYHADTLLGCFLMSLVIEIIFLIVFVILLTPVNCMVIVILCCCILFLFSPYNHSNMHYSIDEIIALKKSIRRRLVIILLLALIMRIMHWDNGLRGLVTGIAMATFMLCLAYYLEWRKQI